MTEKLNLASWPNYSEEEIQKVAEVLRSNRVNYWTGEEGHQFEREFADYVGTRYGVAVANGTLALDLIIRALGIGPGDEVIVTSRTFIASIDCIVTAGATPVFADIDRASQNITAETIARIVTDKTRAIICVHLAGWPCDMDPIMELAGQHDLTVIEDCAQAHGARYKGRAVGSLGHVAAWSFCQDKIMTTGGEGGMITTSDEGLWNKIWSLKDHGKSYDAVYHREHPPGFRWLHESFGTNARMTEMQAAIGRIQLKKLDSWIHTRRAYARKIQQVCQPFSGLRVPVPGDGIYHAYYKCYVFVKPTGLKPGWDRERIQLALEDEGVPVFQGSCSEVYLEKAFDNTGFRPQERLPVAQELGETSLMFLVHPSMSEAEVDAMCGRISKVLSQASWSENLGEQEGQEKSGAESANFSCRSES